MHCKVYSIWILLTIFLLSNNTCLATKSLTINGTRIIDKPTTFSNIILNLDQGAFLIKNNASLDIINCIINVTMTRNNPFFISLLTGNLTLHNNIVNVTAIDLPVTPSTQSLYYAIQIQQANKVNISDNQFAVDKFFSVGWILTHSEFSTSGFQISHNKITNFHGGIYLFNSNNGLISHNLFSHVSFANIWVTSDNCKITDNNIISPGNNFVGDAIDIVDAKNTTIANNFIASPSCYAIFICRAKNALIDNNKIVSGITYGIFIVPTLSTENRDVQIDLTKAANQYIIITHNYLSQNRFGLAAKSVHGLFVHDNYYIQRFANDASRIFWTNNDNLFSNIKYFVWSNNFYKEAVTQAIPSNDTNTSTFVVYPRRGGVILK